MMGRTPWKVEGTKVSRMERKRLDDGNLE